MYHIMSYVSHRISITSYINIIFHMYHITDMHEDNFYLEYITLEHQVSKLIEEPWYGM